MKTNKETSLPFIQKEFINQFDGTLLSAIRYPHLNIVLNPIFTAHYFYVSGTTDQNTITTKHTDGSFAYWGNQTEEAMENAYVLAEELRQFILSFNPITLEEMVNFDHEEMRKYGKISRVRKRATFKIEGEIYEVLGLNL